MNEIVHAQQAWNNGFQSAASLCQSVCEDILSKATYDNRTLSYSIPAEVFDVQLSRVKDGLYKSMRVGQKAGLDFYLNNTWDATDARSLEEFGIKRRES